MVKVRGFDGFTFKPQLYGQILNKNMEYLGECDLFHSFNTQQFLTKGFITPENNEFMYLYEQQFMGFSSLGLLAQLSLNEYAQKKIKQHQKTLYRPHLNENTYIKDHVGPVIVGHQHMQQIDEVLCNLKNTLKLFVQWQTVDGRSHKLWKVTQFQELLTKFDQISSFYILDGHHRFQAASKYLQNLGEQAKQKHKWIQGLVYSTKYVKTYPQFRKLIHQDYQKIIRNLMRNQKLIIQQLESYDSKNEELDLVLLQDQKFYKIRSLQGFSDVPQKSSVQLLDQILKQAMNEIDGKCLNPIKFIPSILFDFNNISIHSHPVFLVKCPQVSAIFSIADQNEFLPPKSTWLEPKPCLHMVIRVPY